MAQKYTSLGDLCVSKIETIKSNAAPKIDYIDIASVNNVSKTVTGFTSYDIVDAPSRARQIVKENDILVSTVRPNLNAVAMVEERYDNLLVASTGFCVLRPKDGVDARFIYHYCQSKNFVDDMVKQATGASYPAVTDRIVKAAKIPNYSKEKQDKIATVLDCISNMIEQRKQALQLLDDLVKSRFIELFGDPVSNVHNWKVCTFEDMSEIITDGEHATPERTDKGHYLLSARNVHYHSLQLDDVDYIGDAEYDRISKRIVPQVGDVLISCSGTVGRCCVVPSGLKFQMVRSVALIRFKDIINPVFAEWLISSDGIQNQIAQSATQSAQANLFQGKIKQLKGLVPPLDLQNQFADFVHQVDKSKFAVQRSIEALTTLKASLMQEYFQNDSAEAVRDDVVELMEDLTAAKEAYEEYEKDGKKSRPIEELWNELKL